MIIFSMDPSCPSHTRLFRLAYRGESMQGIFREGDCLWIEPIPFQEVRVGDVVAFTSGAKTVAHRVVAVGDRGLLTRGDAAMGPDPSPVTPDHLLGKVVMRERRGKRCVISGGPLGRGRGGMLHGIARLRRWLLFPLAPAYRWLRASRWASRVWTPRVGVVRFAGPEGELVKYIHRGQTVARWFPGEQRWTCRKPYDLVLAPPSR
jgi:hypothetical protein